MFYPQAMTEIELIVPAKDMLAVTKVLSGRGVFQQTNSNDLITEPNLSQNNNWQETSASYASLERRILAILQALSLEEGRPPAGDLDSLLELGPAEATVGQIEAEVKQVTDRLTEAQKHLEHLEITLRELEPLAGIDLDISMLHGSRYLFMILGILPVENLERLQTSLSRIQTEFVVLSKNPRKAVVWLASTKENAGVLERAARSAYVNPLTLPEGYQGTPAEIVEKLQGSIAEIQASNAREKDCLNSLGKAHQSVLQSLLWDVRASHMMTDAILHYGQLRHTYFIVGWAPTARVGEVIERLKLSSRDIIIETFPYKRDGSRKDIPVSLNNSKLLRPFQSLVTTYAQPRYEEIDPTLLIAVTFPVLFGAMFGDVGQGLVLAGLGWLLMSRKVKALNSLAGLGGLITACGLVATVFGFLYGSVFGIEDLIPALWMRPMENIMTILGIAIGGGVVLLSVGFIMGMINAFIARDWGRLFFDHNGVAGFVLYWSLIGLVLGSGMFIQGVSVPTRLCIVLVCISGVFIMFSEIFKNLVDGHRPLLESGIGTYAIQAFFELFETFIGFLSNSLSYVRVGAFAVAHAGLSGVIFILAEMVNPGEGVGYWLVVVLGNLFIVGFEGLIVGIQTMRLEYYEFFSKFFTGGGARYQPLALRPTAEE
jgi:V/A-type H+/Na+-transporting ATPase subunit I